MRFATRLTILLGILASGLALLLSMIVSSVVDRSVEESARARLQGEAQFLASQIRAVEKARGSATDFIHQASRELAVRVSVIRADGVVVTDSEIPADELRNLDNHSGRPEVIEAKQGPFGFAIRYSRTLDQDLFYLARRIDASGDVIRLAVPYSDLKHLESRYEWRARVAIFASCALLFFVGSTAAWRMSAPIQRVSEAALAVAHGNLDREPPSDGPFEIVELSSALRRMKRSLLDSVARVESEHALATRVFETLPDGTVVIDDHWRILEANPRFRELLEADCRPGEPLVDVLRDGKLFALFETAVRNKQVVTDMIQRDRDRTWEISVHPLDDSPRAVAVGIIHDITPFKRNEAMRRRFVADVSHELRTPITSISAAAATLESIPSNDPEAPGLLGVIRRQASRMTELIEELTELSSIESGGVILTVAPIDLAKLARDVSSDFLAASNPRRIEVQHRAHTGPAWISGDERRIAQIVRNLVDNAVKFSPDGAIVDVGVDTTGDSVVLSVTDRGEGIPEKDVSRVFQRFYQVDRSRSNRPGVGLGLAIVKHLAQLHEATIEVESQVGAGSVFRVRFPRHESASDAKEIS